MRTRSLTCARLLLLLVMPAASACSPRAIDPGSDGPSPKVPRDASLDRSRDSKRPELDVLPVLEIGAHAVHVPYHITWSAEHAEHDGSVPTLDSITQLPDWLASQR